MSRRDAAALACSLRVARDAYPQSKWPRKVRIGLSGAVLEPASGTFDVTVPTGEDVQAAVDACPRGGCVLLLPGTYDGPLLLEADQVVHVFGRGRATLRAAEGSVLTSEAAEATCDGLIVRREEVANLVEGEVEGAETAGDSVWIRRGRMRLQACDLFNASEACLKIEGGADPFVSSCK